MDCRETRLQLNALLDGELPADQADAVRAHLDGCAACRAEFAALGELGRGIAALPEQSTPPQFLAEVRARLERPEPVGWVDRLFRPFWLKIPMEALAVIAVALVVVSVFWNPPARLRSENKDTFQPASPAPAADEFELALPRAKSGRGALRAQIAPEEELADDSEPADRREMNGAFGFLSREDAARAPEASMAERAPDELKTEVDMAATPRFNLPHDEALASAGVPSPAVIGGEGVEAGEAELGKESLFPTIEVATTDFVRARQQVGRAVAKVGGRVIDQSEGNARLRVELPAAQLPVFRRLLAESRDAQDKQDSANQNRRSVMLTAKSPVPTGSEGQEEGAVSNVVIDVQIRLVTEP